jgi:DeoR family transcriptional regulator, aga operon transcriptional repressor
LIETSQLPADTAQYRASFARCQSSAAECTLARMTASSRRGVILDLLTRNGFVDVSGLQRQFGCSEATVRRDLDRLQREGRLRRTHGGAVLDGQRERAITARAAEWVSEKQAIARAAVQMVPDGAAVGIGGGTTTQFVARALAGRSGLTVVTNAINIAMELVSKELRVIVTGGELRSETYELVGPLAEPAASQLHLDLIFVGVDGLSVDGGLTTHNPVEARIDRVLIDQANEVVVVADHTKLGRKTFARIAPLEAAHTLITDRQADLAVVGEMERSGLRVVIAPPADESGPNDA